MNPLFLVLNAGSSSLKAQIFEDQGEADAALRFRVLVEGIGGSTRLIARDASGAALDTQEVGAPGTTTHDDALTALVGWLRSRTDTSRLQAVGHRVVHGGANFIRPALVDDATLDALQELVPLAPLHQPHNLEPIRIIRRRMPSLPQIASFDTAFHATQPDLATLFALPKAMRDRGVRRYGFHGLSYDYVASRLHDLDPRLAAGRVVVAHLGNGASLCALEGARSIATTMGFSALDGLPMGTRCGALDPAVVFYMLREMKLSAEEAERMLYSQSGLLGVSGRSNDMRTLRAAAGDGDADARRAIDLFVYRIAREVGSLTAALGGLDGLVFTGGIGENDAATRAEVLARLAFMGFRLDEAANRQSGPRVIAGPTPAAWVVPTDEERVIVRQMQAVLDHAAETARG
jgi:acetate kinase